MYKNHFPKIYQLVFSQWGFGSDVTKPGGLSPQVGILYIFMVLGSIYIAFKNKKEKKIIIGWLIIFLFAILITLPISSFVWEQLPFIKKFEFPWRFIGLASFAASVLTCYFLMTIKNKKVLVGIVIVLLLSSISFLKLKESPSHNDIYYHAFRGATYFHGEATPIWTAGNPGKYPKAPVEIIGGKGMISDLKKKSQLHTFTVDAKGTVTIVDNTHYFPGWKAFLDDREVPTQEFQDPNHRGLIVFNVQEGKHNIKVEFNESKVRLFAGSISLIAWIVVIGNLIALLYNKKIVSRSHE